MKLEGVGFGILETQFLHSYEDSFPLRDMFLKFTLIFAIFLISTSFTHAQEKHDRICPELAFWYQINVWDEYKKSQSEYIEQLLRRQSDNLQAVLDAKTISDRTKAAKVLGEDNVLVMQRMFEQGLIAQQDYVYAHCKRAPGTEPFSPEIKQENERKYCEMMSKEGWNDIYFCQK